jgi:hypothetical protein
MAEAFGLALGRLGSNDLSLLGLVGFAFETSLKLSVTLQSFRNYPSNVSELKYELKAFRILLGSVQEIVEAKDGADFSTLRVQLQECIIACKKFEHESIKRLSQPDSGETIFPSLAGFEKTERDLFAFRVLLSAHVAILNTILMGVKP